MDLQSSLYYSATFLAGGVFAWWLRSRRDLPERMRLVEHFERRARLAETEQEQAIRTLNENEIRTRKIEGTYDGLRTKVRELEEEGQATEQQALALREALQAREAELGEVQARVGGLEASNKDLTKRTAEAEDRRKLADSSIDGVRKELAKATRELELSKAEGARLKERLLETEQRAEEAERLQVALAEVRGALGERETLLQEMRSRVDELKEEVERLSSVEAELEARRRDLVQRDAQLAELRKRLEGLPSAQRGFAYEGAAMALALLDALSIFRKNRWLSFAEGVGQPHLYMVYVGLGFAAARLRRTRAFARPTLDPHLRWLVLDGYGFHEGFFRGASEPEKGTPYRETSYAQRAFDQGLGRSLWFVEGAHTEPLVARIARFDEPRRADLWSGVGLAACYAGAARAVDGEIYRELLDRAAPHGKHFAQGVAFAAEARERAGNATETTEAACRAVWNGSSVFCAELVRRLRENLPGDGRKPAYELWRERVREAWRPSDVSHTHESQAGADWREAEVEAEDGAEA